MTSSSMTNGTGSEFEARNYLEVVLHSFSQYTWCFHLSALFISLPGFVFNYFTYKVSLALPHQSTSTILMSYLAVWDSLSAFQLGVLRNSFQVVGMNNPADTNTLSCKLLGYLSLTTTLQSIILLTALAFDRSLALVFPFWHRNRNKHKYSQKIFASLSVSVYIVLLPYLYYLRLDHDSCSTDIHNNPLYEVYNMFIMAVLFFVLPISVVLLSNSIFAYFLWHQNKPFSERRARLQMRNPIKKMFTKDSDKQFGQVFFYFGKAKDPVVTMATVNTKNDSYSDLCWEVYCGPASTSGSNSTNGHTLNASRLATNMLVFIKRLSFTRFSKLFLQHRVKNHL